MPPIRSLSKTANRALRSSSQNLRHVRQGWQRLISRPTLRRFQAPKLPIATKPSADVPVQIYVGESPHAAKLGVTSDGLKHGAYRIVSGDNWLALIGDDRDFEPVHPFARNHGDIPRAQAEWEKIVGAPYGMPSRGLYKNRLRLPGETGKPDGAVTDKKETLEIWGFDERGSFNAVCGYLRKLGARWYLPGELGEVLPEMKTIPLPSIDETAIPDFPLRQFNFRFSTAGYETSMWAMRLGTRNDARIHLAHGMSGMTNNEKVFAGAPGVVRHSTAASAISNPVTPNASSAIQTRGFSRKQCVTPVLCSIPTILNVYQ